MCARYRTAIFTELKTSLIHTEHRLNTAGRHCIEKVLLARFVHTVYIAEMDASLWGGKRSHYQLGLPTPLC